MLDLQNGAAIFLGAGTSYSLFGPYTGGGLSGGSGSGPWAVAIDAAGHAWIADQEVTSTIVELNPNGAPLFPGVGFVSGGTIDGALGIAVDQSGNVWVADGNQTLSICWSVLRCRRSTRSSPQ